MLRFCFVLNLACAALAALTWKTQDISSLLVEEAKGVVYKSLEGSAHPLEALMKQGGANSAKIRVWVNPPDGNYNLNYALKLGKRAQAAGLAVVLNLHYSDTWADPGHQIKPAAWSNLGAEQLIAKVKNYTTEVLDAFFAAGLDVNLVGIGNEVRAGLLWPTAKYDQMGNIAKILTAASHAVRNSQYKSKAKVMIHLDRGYSWSTQEWFYDGIVKAGFNMRDVDVQGISFYPFWDPKESTFDNFRSCMTNMAKKYGKIIVVTETDWPTKCSQAGSNIPPSLRSIPFTPAGQVTWMQKVAEVVKAVPNGLGQGIMYWEPGWIDNASLGSKCEDGGTLFKGDWSNKSHPVAMAHPSINMFKAI
ncbi:glycosyl hydrolase 53 [Trichodelitschia bisporula]|uniref:Arabinogalactan endo-beta-1,4-galactanase n=1 Tax=Trichodelitschia bisporula TaxID=703511 RepID=A0A6G1HZ90_9PEZI|nr:glycosyl hydrolase 53 [Trichodelitschia bisporula]